MSIVTIIRAFVKLREILASRLEQVEEFFTTRSEPNLW
jgi:hypothetical protein